MFASVSGNLSGYIFEKVLWMYLASHFLIMTFYRLVGLEYKWEMYQLKCIESENVHYDNNSHIQQNENEHIFFNKNIIQHADKNTMVQSEVSIFLLRTSFFK